MHDLQVMRLRFLRAISLREEAVKRTREQALATRASLLEAAAFVFYEKGFPGATLADIAKHAGVTRGAVYGHFTNKVVLLDAVFEAAVRPLDPFMVNLALRKDFSIEGLIAEIRRCWREATDAPHTVRMYALVYHLFENAAEAAQLFERVERACRDSENRFEEWLRRAMADARLPPSFDAHTGARVIHATLSGLLRRWLLNPAERNLPETEVGKIVRAILLHRSD
ncbi:TetR family transcriptional regulator [Burkholderia sp. Ax-1719]|nr:TetR family transcriptional regulator [Burkholderia sp. Ax-1719]